MLTTYIYDEFGRIVKKAEIGLSKNAIVTEYTYNFVGDATLEVTNYYSYNAEDNTLDESVTTFIENKYDSPHTKLLTSSVINMYDHQTGHNMTDTIQHLSYDDFGRVICNDRGGSKADMSYEYDLLHGWTTGIRSGGGFVQTLFRENSDANPRWDGSITAMEWKNSASGQIKRYDYAYDELKRLAEAVYSEPSASDANVGCRERGFEEDDVEIGGYIPNPSQRIVTNKYGEAYTYDMNSNMTSLCRYGMLNDRSYDLIDNLAIEYDGNQRMSIQDAVTERMNYAGASDFVNGADSIIEYAYDGNGNLLRDRNKGLNFAYDLLGHPLRVWSDDGKDIIEYVYAPDGRKLRTRHSRNRVTTVKDYRGALEVVNGEIDRINFQGGFYSYDYADDHYSRNYYIQDYQGNTRMTERMDDWGDYISETTVSVTDYYPYGNPHKSSSGYKYSGKYLDRSYGLDLYDFEARQYDAIVPGFNSQDQLAEKYYGISPYAYCGGDPVNFVDPTGESTQVVMMDSIHYMVLDGAFDDDNNIYVVAYNDNGELERTGQSIGESATQWSFFNSDTESWETGSIIDLSDNTAISFMEKIDNESENLISYIDKGRNGGEYDIKAKGDMYRGMPAPMMGSSKTIASARDLGNYGAGYKAGSKGLSAILTFAGFSIYDCYKNARLGIEPIGSRLPQWIGYKNGFKSYITK